MYVDLQVAASAGVCLRAKDTEMGAALWALWLGKTLASFFSILKVIVRI